MLSRCVSIRDGTAPGGFTAGVYEDLYETAIVDLVFDERAVYRMLYYCAD